MGHHNKRNLKVFGFALPTVLIASVVMLLVLTTTISSTVAIRGAVRDQHYTQLAKLAGEAGTAFASACLSQTNGSVTWSDAQPLRPNTNCRGEIQEGRSAYVAEEDNLRTYFVVDSNGESQGYTEAVRTSTGLAWQVWKAPDVAALTVQMDRTPVGTSIEGYWAAAPAGYLLEDGACVSQSEYSALYTAIGSFFGTSGCSAGQFRLPDSRGRVAVAKSTDTEFNTIGKKYGEKAHTLTLAEIPPRTDQLRTDYAWEGVGARQGVAAGGQGGTVDHYNLTGGGGAAHNNIQPSIVVTRAIKY